MCNASIEYYKEIQKSINLGLKEVGYLWLLNEEQMQSRRNKTIKQLGTDRVFSLLDFLDVQKVRYKIFSQEELRKIFPTLNINEEIQYGLLGFQCGTLAPDLVVKYYETQYKDLGGKTNYGEEVISILLKEKGQEFDEDYFSTVWRDSEVAGIKLENVKTHTTQIIQTKKLILCTGAWANQLLYTLGIHIGINAKKRQLFRIKNKKDFVINPAFTNEFQSIPFIILPSGGVFIKPIPENGSVDVGCSDDLAMRFEFEPDLADKNYDSFKNNLDTPHGELKFYQTDVLPVLQTFFPKEFNEKVQIENPSAGMYAYSLV